MKAVIEENNGLYIIRINGNEGALCDVHVVDMVEIIMGQDEQGEDLRFALERE